MELSKTKNIRVLVVNVAAFPTVFYSDDCLSIPLGRFYGGSAAVRAKVRGNLMVGKARLVAGSKVPGFKTSIRMKGRDATAMCRWK